MEGTSLTRFKSAFIAELGTALAAGTVTCELSYQSPMKPADMDGQTGARVAAWWADDAETEHEVNVVAATPVIVDETCHPKFRIQSLGINSDDTQDVVDGRANEVLGYALAVLARDPTVGLEADEDIREFAAVAETWTYSGGALNDLRAARFELTIESTARLTLDLPA